MVVVSWHTMYVMYPRMSPPDLYLSDGCGWMPENAPYNIHLHTSWYGYIIFIGDMKIVDILESADMDMMNDCSKLAKFCWPWNWPVGLFLAEIRSKCMISIQYAECGGVPSLSPIKCVYQVLDITNTGGGEINQNWATFQGEIKFIHILWSALSTHWAVIK